MECTVEWTQKFTTMGRHCKFSAAKKWQNGKIRSLNISGIHEHYIQNLGFKINNTHSPLSNSTMPSHHIAQLINTDILISI